MRLTPQRLVADLGAELAARLMALYGGRRVRVPRPPVPITPAIAARNAAICAALDDDEPYRAVAFRYQLSVSQVFRIYQARSDAVAASPKHDVAPRGEEA